jgi:oligopeptidase A
MVCNFSGGVDGKPALLTHDDAITLFHEFGHGLHHMLTQVNEHDVSGISGVEWDAVELPSQFMENFCWEWDVLRDMTAHAETGEALPRSLFDSMLAAKNFQSGMQTLRQVEFCCTHPATTDLPTPLGIFLQVATQLVTTATSGLRSCQLMLTARLKRPRNTAEAFWTRPQVSVSYKRSCTWAAPDQQWRLLKPSVGESPNWMRC